MRGYLPDFELRQASGLADALAVLSREPGSWRVFAGGTDLMVLLEAGKLPPSRYLSLWNVSELRGVLVTATHVSIGALTTYTDVLADPTLSSEFPLLGAAARETGGLATQNRGTIGGNIANASPAADTPPALLVYDAELELLSARGTRVVPYDRFHKGYKVMDLAPDEIIGRVRLARGRSGWVERYRKVGTRRAQAISKVCFAAGARIEAGVAKDVRIALGSVAPTVVRCRTAEAAIRGQRLAPGTIAVAAQQLLKDIAPIDDIRSTAAYRRRVAQNLLQEFLREHA
ncbi:MAG TPA: xanthine dehydrogenase family protein subunit M [Vicinamibacterales bacterium]